MTDRVDIDQQQYEWSTFTFPALFTDRPFRDQASDDDCTVCGKRIKPGKGYWVHAIRGGATLLATSEWVLWQTISTVEDRVGDMGCWRVGPDCGRSIPKQYRMLDHTFCEGVD